MKVAWQERAQFFAMAVQRMWPILVGAAPKQASNKRGRMAAKVNLEQAAVLPPCRIGPFRDPSQAKVVELRTSAHWRRRTSDYHAADSPLPQGVPTLFPSQSDQGIHSGGALRRQQARQERDSHE
jgi:hypothetical protein